MKSIKTEIIINASVETVWNILTNFEAYPSWNPFIVSVKGNLGKGEELVNVMMNNGKKNTFKPIITVLEEQHKFEWIGKLPLGMFNGNHYFQINQINAKSTKLIHGEHFSGWLSGLIMYFIGEETLRGFNAMNEALKVKAETIG
jgi:hypothetical protein